MKLALNPRGEVLWQVLVPHQVIQGREAAKNGNHEAAVALYGRAIDSDPKYADAYVERIPWRPTR